MVQFDTMLSQSLVLSLPGIYFLCISRGRGWGADGEGELAQLSKAYCRQQVKGRAILELRTSSFGCGELLFGTDISLII